MTDVRVMARVYESNMSSWLRLSPLPPTSLRFLLEMLECVKQIPAFILHAPPLERRVLS